MSMQKFSVCDVTMKVADNSPELSLSFKEKIEMAKLLDRLQISVIEVSPIVNQKIDSLLVKSIAMAVKHAIVAAPVTLDENSLDITMVALKDAKNARLQFKAPMSPAQMEYFWHKKPDKTLATITEYIKACREKCADVEFIADDACRAEPEFLYTAVRAAISAGATVVTLCDAAGLMFPEEFTGFIENVKANVPELANVRLGVMCSDELSMASACAMAAVRAGAVEVKTIACDGGVTRLDNFASIIRNRLDIFGGACDLRFTELNRVVSQIEWMCRSARSKSALSEGGLRDNAEAADMALTKNDDLSTVIKAVERIGYDLSEEDNGKVYEAFQRIAAQKGTVSARELDSIVASAAMQVPPTYRLNNYVINCGNNIAATAHIIIEKGEEKLEGVTLGDGPIDAAFLAVEQVAGYHYELDDFQIQAVTEGREALGETVVRLRAGGKLYSGRGLSTDIVGASIRAYINALNKIVYEEVEA